MQLRAVGKRLGSSAQCVHVKSETPVMPELDLLAQAPSLELSIQGTNRDESYSQRDQRGRHLPGMPPTRALSLEPHVVPSSAPTSKNILRSRGTFQMITKSWQEGFLGLGAPTTGQSGYS